MDSLKEIFCVKEPFSLGRNSFAYATDSDENDWEDEGLEEERDEDDDDDDSDDEDLEERFFGIYTNA